jgi:hypothetical protein
MSHQCCGGHQLVYIHTLKCTHRIPQAPSTLTHPNVHRGWQLPETRRGRAMRHEPPLTAALQTITSLRSLATCVRDAVASAACTAVPAGNSAWTSLLCDSCPGAAFAAAAADMY